MKTIESSKASGADKKDAASMLANPISALCKLSISLGVFPNAYKVAKLKPIF